MKAYALTDIGKMRKVNQDAQFASTEPVGELSNLFVVADGMGGHQAGDFASRYLIEHMPEYIKESGENEPVAALRKGIEAVNQELYSLSCEREELAGMGTTLVAASIQGNTLYVANVGDSRLYRIERSGIHQITRDHSYVEAMVSLGQMSRGSREYETKKNIITRAVGIGGHVEPDFFEVSLNPGDYILLCSDGLTNMVDNSAIYRMVLLPGSLDTKARALTALANQNGGKDNIAVILIDPQIRGGERIMMLKPGTYLQDRYEILSLIGTGGMSEVYQAKCHTLNRLVAIKVLKDEYSQDANFVSKFKMEAQAAAGLSHPNIVSVYDVVDEGSLHYIVMELIEGITLKSYILKKGHLGVKETIGIAIQVAQGLAAAHDQHIVHRDIKPQNMIISRDGKVKVADFGIARAVSSQTIGVNAVGSVHYISPEQAKGNYSDGRSDLYSLGITMYEMLTGKLPFDGDTPVSVALAHLEEPVQPPSRINPEVSASLDRIILKCTQKKPERRYQNAYELIADLRHALVDPNDDFLKKEPEFDENSPTVVRGAEELNRQMEAQRNRNLEQTMEHPAVSEKTGPVPTENERGEVVWKEPEQPEKEIEGWQEEETDVYEEETSRRPDRRRKGRRIEEDSEDVNPQIGAPAYDDWNRCSRIDCGGCDCHCCEVDRHL